MGRPNGSRPGRADSKRAIERTVKLIGRRTELPFVARSVMPMVGWPRSAARDGWSRVGRPARYTVMSVPAMVSETMPDG